jgi:hypothetical protein
MPHLPEEQTGDVWEPSNKQCFFRKSGSIGEKSIFHAHKRKLYEGDLTISVL